MAVRESVRLQDGFLDKESDGEGEPAAKKVKIDQEEEDDLDDK